MHEIHFLLFPLLFLLLSTAASASDLLAMEHRSIGEDDMGMKDDEDMEGVRSERDLGNPYSAFNSHHAAKHLTHTKATKGHQISFEKFSDFYRRRNSAGRYPPKLKDSHLGPRHAPHPQLHHPLPHHPQPPAYPQHPAPHPSPHPHPPHHDPYKVPPHPHPPLHDPYQAPPHPHPPHPDPYHAPPPPHPAKVHHPYSPPPLLPSPSPPPPVYYSQELHNPYPPKTPPHPPLPHHPPPPPAIRQLPVKGLHHPHLPPPPPPYHPPHPHPPHLPADPYAPPHPKLPHTLLPHPHHHFPVKIHVVQQEKPGQFVHHLSGRKFMAGKVISLSKAIELGIIGRHNPNEDSSSSEEEGEQAATNPYRPYFPFQHRHPNTAAGLYHQTAAGAAAADGSSSEEESSSSSEEEEEEYEDDEYYDDDYSYSDESSEEKSREVKNVNFATAEEEREVAYSDEGEGGGKNAGSASRASRQFLGDDNSVQSEEEEETVVTRGQYVFKFRRKNSGRRKSERLRQSGPVTVIKSKVVEQIKEDKEGEKTEETDEKEEEAAPLLKSDTVEVLLGEKDSDVSGPIKPRPERLVIVKEEKEEEEEEERQHSNDAARSFWPYLNSTWHSDPRKGFFPQPRTEREAQREGWVKISECEDGQSRFPGRRYLRSLTDDDLDDVILIFDASGFIAGVQSLVPQDRIEASAPGAAGGSHYDFDHVPFYQKEALRGRQVYFVTAYLVDPALICSIGRSPRQFKSEGTGHALLIQAGLSDSVEGASDLVAVPVTQEGAENDGGWSRKACVPSMGQHFFPATYDKDGDCRNLTPFSVTYGGDGFLNGFAFTHVAPLTGNRWEVETSSKAGLSRGDAPKCFAPLTDNPGVRSMHFFLADNHISCQ